MFSYILQIPVKPQPSRQSPATTVMENNLAVKGFQRFLSVLNKGVDIDMLNRIVNDNEHPPPTGQGLLHSSQTPAVKEESGVCESDSQPLQCGAGQRDRPSGRKERPTELLDQHISIEPCKKNIQREEKPAQSDAGVDRHFGSSRRSRSPPVVEEKKPKLEQHQEDLQNILNMIGFSMDADDMSKLAERTQNRLYGIENETKLRMDGTAPSKRSRQHVRRDRSRSASSTSLSDRSSSSPSRHQHSLSKTSRDSGEQTQISEYGLLHCRQRNREMGIREQSREQDREKNTIASRDGSTGPDAACAIPMYNSDASTFAIPSYISVQQSDYSAHHSDTSSCASLNYGSSDITPSLTSNPPAFCNYSMTPLCPAADTGALDGRVYPHPYLPAGCNTALGHSHFNADLSLTENEGQTGKKSAICVINTERRISQKHERRQLASFREIPSDQFIGEKRAGVERIPSNSHLSLSEGQTGQQTTVNTVTKAEQKEGQIESQSPFSWLKEQLTYVSTLFGTETETQAKDTTPKRCGTGYGWVQLEKELRNHLFYGILIFKKLEQNSKLKEGQAGLQSVFKKVTKPEIRSKEKEMAEQKEGPNESQIRIQRLQFEVVSIYCLLPVGIECSFPWLSDELRFVRTALANCDLLKHNPEWLRKQLAAKEQYISMILNPNTVPQSSTRRPLPEEEEPPFSWLKEQLKYVRKQTENQVKYNELDSEWLRKQLAAKERYILMILNKNVDLSRPNWIEICRQYCHQSGTKGRRRRKRKSETHTRTTVGKVD